MINLTRIRGHVGHVRGHLNDAAPPTIPTESDAPRQRGPPGRLGTGKSRLTSTSVSVAFVSVRARAAVSARGIGTRGVQMARGFVLAALVHVGTLEPVQPGVSGVALAHVRPGSVHANRGVGVAVVSVLASDTRTLVHICTPDVRGFRVRRVGSLTRRRN